MMQLAVDDQDIMALTNCDEDGAVVSNIADYTGKLEIPTNGKLVVSAAAPYFVDGKFRGAVCNDIDINTLNRIAANINYQDAGKGMIIDSNGTVIASADPAEILRPVDQNPVLRDHFQSIVEHPEGFFSIDENVFAYTTVESTGRIVGILVPNEPARGNFRVADLPVDGADEFGEPAQAFRRKYSQNRRCRSRRRRAYEPRGRDDEQYRKERDGIRSGGRKARA